MAISLLFFVVSNEILTGFVKALIMTKLGNKDSKFILHNLHFYIDSQCLILIKRVKFFNFFVISLPPCFYLYSLLVSHFVFGNKHLHKNSINRVSKYFINSSFPTGCALNDSLL